MITIMALILAVVKKVEIEGALMLLIADIIIVTVICNAVVKIFA